VAHRPTTPLRLLLVVAVSFGAVLACAVLCGKLLGLLERPDGATALDQSITAWVVAHRAPAWTALAHVLSTVGSQAVLTPLTVLVTALLLARRQFVVAAKAVAAWGGAILLYTLIKHVVHRMRPPSEIWLTEVGKTTSFPSGHATQSLATFMALALALGAWRCKPAYTGRALALVVAAGVGCSRVYLGVHWTTDVVAGWLIGTAWIASLAWAAGIVRRRGDATSP